MEEKMGKLKELVNNFGGQDIRDQVHNIFRFQWFCSLMQIIILYRYYLGNLNYYRQYLF